MFIVHYQSDFGKSETFGFFNTALDAAHWMEKDVAYNIENAKKNNVELIAEKTNNGMSMFIDNYGTWTVEQVIPVGN